MANHQRIFTQKDQEAFARLSGDANPMHMDPVAARRLIFGQQVVHGIHVLLWSLDTWFAEKNEPVSLLELKAQFKHPVRVGDLAEFSVKKEEDGKAVLEVHTKGQKATVIRLAYAPTKTLTIKPENVFPEQESATALEAKDLEGHSGKLPLVCKTDTLAKLFSHLQLPFMQTALLLATTRLVGMRCPGLHSVYGDLKLELGSEAEGLPELTWDVEGFDARFGLVNINLKAPGAKGSISAMLRPAPQGQAPFAEFKNKVDPKAFTNQRALVIGGSRGLGEVAAKLLAAGGADVTVSYARGQADAKALVADINGGGGQAAFCAIDVTQAANPGVLPDGFAPTHLYYFATPHIAQGVKGVFSDDLYNVFLGFYTEGLSQWVSALAPLGLKAVFNPSSVFIDEPPPDMAEYAKAKQDAEEQLHALTQKHTGLTAYSPRLPKTQTDQTVSFMPAQNPDPVPLLLAHLEELQKISHA